MLSPRTLSILKTTATALIVGLSIYFSVWKVDFVELGKSFERVNYGLAALIFPLTILSHWIRAVRWKVMVRGRYPTLGLGPLFAGVMVGYFMNNLIPRSGELARPWVTSQEVKDVPYSGLLGTIIIERFLDVLALLAFVFTLLLLDGSMLKGFEGYGLSMSTIQNLFYPAFALGLLILIIAPSQLGMTLARWAVRPVPARVAEKILSLFSNLQDGFRSLRTVSQILQAIGYTVVMYLLYLLPMYLMLFAFPDEIAPTSALLDAGKILALTSLAFAVAPTPGAFGVFHVTARVAVMNISGFTYANAVAYAAITHFVNYVSVMMVGGWYLAKMNGSVWEMVQRKR